MIYEFQENPLPKDKDKYDEKFALIRWGKSKAEDWIRPPGCAEGEGEATDGQEGDSSSLEKPAREPERLRLTKVSLEANCWRRKEDSSWSEKHAGQKSGRAGESQQLTGVCTGVKTIKQSF